MIIPENVQITVNGTYDKFCDYSCILDEHLEDLPDKGIIFAPNDIIRSLFIEIENRKLPGPFIIVSGASDFGLCYQDEFPVNPDLPKALHRVDFSEYYTIKDKYLDFVLGAACHKFQCSPSDKYSLRCYHYTHATFNEIPSQIKYWYSANLNINNNNRLSCIPLGLLHTVPESVIIKPAPINKKLLYVNFSNITIERKWFKEEWLPKLMDDGGSDWITFKENVSREEYLEDLQHHIFCLAPGGNGPDAYRITECMILGVIPIVKKTIWSSFFCDLPFLNVESFKSITKEFLLMVLHNSINKQFSLEKFTKQYWENEIKNKWK